MQRPCENLKRIYFRILRRMFYLLGAAVAILLSKILDTLILASEGYNSLTAMHLFLKNIECQYSNENKKQRGCKRIQLKIAKVLIHSGIRFSK